MKKIFKLSPALLLGVLAACTSGGHPEQPTKTIENTQTETTAEATETTVIPESKLSYRKLTSEVNAYYSSVNTNLRGDAFLSALTPVISDGYVKYSYSEAWRILADADKDPYNSSNIICVYTGRSIPANLDSGKAWNREHAWAKSHGFNHESNPAYTDCHHLTASESSINNARGDLDIGEVADFTGDVKTDLYGNQWIQGTIFEPRDEVKGDMARKLFYMMARYNDATLDLTLVEKKDTPTSTSDDGTGKLGVLSTLLKWHYQDPVSDSEIRRNEVVYSYQKNRNPFIDHPEWVNYAFESRYTDYTVNEDSVLSVIDAIAKLPENVTLENKNAVEAAYASVSALNAQEKLFVNNYPKLSQARYQVTYLENKAKVSDADILIDMAADQFKKATTGYEADYTFSVSDYSFKTSSAMVDGGGFHLGTNAKKVSPTSLSAFGVSANGSYMESQFSTPNITKIRVRVLSPAVTTYQLAVKTTDGCRLLETKTVTENSNTYWVAECDSLSGTIVVLITGDKPRVGIDQIEIYTEK